MDSNKYQRCSCNRPLIKSRLAVLVSNTQVPDRQLVLPKGDIDYQQVGLLLIAAGIREHQAEICSGCLADARWDKRSD